MLLGRDRRLFRVSPGIAGAAVHAGLRHPGAAVAPDRSGAARRDDQRKPVARAFRRLVRRRHHHLPPRHADDRARRNLGRRSAGHAGGRARRSRALPAGVPFPYSRRHDGRGCRRRPPCSKPAEKRERPGFSFDRPCRRRRHGRGAGARLDRSRAQGRRADAHRRRAQFRSRAGARTRSRRRRAQSAGCRARRRAGAGGEAADLSERGRGGAQVRRARTRASCRSWPASPSTR